MSPKIMVSERVELPTKSNRSFTVMMQSHRCIVIQPLSSTYARTEITAAYLMANSQPGQPFVLFITNFPNHPV